MLCLAQVALTPLACASFSIPMICSSLNLLFISFCSFYLSRTTLFNCPAFGGQAKKMDHHRWNPPLDELQLIADAVGRVLDSEGHERIRDVLRDVDALEEAVDRLEAYERFRPGRFDRRKLNRRLKQYAQGDEEWLWE